MSMRSSPKAEYEDHFRGTNLVTDRSFNEFQLIVCRNTLIYFNKDLQDKSVTPVQ